MARTIKIDREEDVQEGELVETQWDVKKIAGGLFVLVILGIMASYVLIPGRESGQTLGASSVSMSPTPPLPNKEDVQNIVASAKDTLSQITSENLTSSQAAIQKVISDLQGLQGKSGAVGMFCKLVCSDK